jgi:glycine/D-amino acid oxidase-like deaminating enzyme
VSCAGMWGPKIGRMAGVSVPLLPMQHQFAWTRPLKAWRARRRRFGTRFYATRTRLCTSGSGGRRTGSAPISMSRSRSGPRTSPIRRRHPGCPP